MAETQIGLVAYFDILGYLSFLQSNDVSIATEEVLITLGKMEGEIVESFPPEISGYPLRAELKDHIKWLIFSDTILIYSPVAEDEVSKKLLTESRII